MMLILGARRLRKAVLSLLVLSFMLGGEGGRAFALSLKTFLKTDYGAVSQRPIPRPNVLFLLDTGSPMVFSPKGIMPLRTDGYSLEERARLLKDCTYGSGARPYNNSSAPDRARYGRDLDNSNNRIGDPDCYYTPDPNKPYFLTFKSSAYHVTPPVPAGTLISGYPHYPGSPYPSQAVDAFYDELVPNDSRMYMMKLVLWRLTSPENAELLSRMNVGMATSYQEDSVRAQYFADYYKSPAYGQRNELPYGSAPSWSIGFGTDGTGKGGNYYQSQRAFCGVFRQYICP